ncbi:S-layer homology domain-containing protein [Paenibacillus filicis]|uniref:S-layer homology domain-containing protein n=2 Tax=Paenibacillus filicis TaxID=669464 RepID=A0ABU9DFV2_9BACL
MSMLSGLLVTALLAPAGASYAAAGERALLSEGAVPVLLDIQSVSLDRLQSIQKAATLGLVQGDESGRFRPDDILTRQELAALLVRALKLPIPQSVESFTDVDPQSWSSSYIAAVKQAGLMQGDDQGRFHPAALITREELAIVLVRASQQTPIVDESLGEVTDWGSVSSWAESFVKTAIRGDIVPVSQGRFAPQEPVLRADIAQMLISAFYPDENPALLQDIQNGHIRINGKTYQLSDQVKGIFQENNRKALKGAKLKFQSSGGTIQSITELRLVASGAEPEEGEAEFSRNLKLDGQHAVLNGNLTVSGDYMTVTNLTIKGDLHLRRELEHDFLASGLKVQGNTVIEGGDSNTVVFEESSLQNVDVKKQDVHLVAGQGSSIASVNVQTDASIESTEGSIKKLTLTEGAQSVNLQGSILEVKVTSTQPVTVNGNPSIGKMAVDQGSTVTLTGSASVAEIQLNNKDSKVIASSNTQVGNVTAANGASTSNVQKASEPSPNTPPRLAVPLPELELTVGKPAVQLDLSQYFKDDEQSILKYQASSLKSSVVKSALSGSVLTLTPVAGGSTSVRIIADDQNGGKLTVDMKVTVNALPVANPAKVPAAMLLTAGTQGHAVDLSEIFSDPDKDALTFKVQSSAPDIAKVTEVEGKLTVIPLTSGQTIIKATADDGRGGEASISFAVTVNEAPVVQPIPQRIVQLGGGAQMIDLTSYLSDKEGDALFLTLGTYNSAIASVSLSGQQLQILPIKAGNTRIEFTVSDGRGGITSAGLDLHVNTRPELAQAIPGQWLTAGAADGIVDLSGVFTDAEHDPLTYLIQTSQPSIVTGSEAGGKLTLKAISGGNAQITVTAKDGKGGEAVTSFQVNINEAPVIAPVPVQVIQLGGGARQVDLTSFLSDKEHDPLTLTASVDTPGVAGVSAAGTILTFTPASAGRTQVRFTVKDGRGGEASSVLTLVVNAAPQVVQQPANQHLTVGAPDGELDLKAVFVDPDQDPLSYEFSSSLPGIVQLSEASGKLGIRAQGSGTTTVTIKALDGKGGEAGASFTVTVNEGPVLSAIPLQYVQLGAPAQEFDLTPYVKDKENDAWTVTVDAFPAQTVNVGVTGPKLLLTAVAAGKAEVKLTLNDVRGGVTKGTLYLEVNTAPTVSQTLPKLIVTAGQAPGLVDLAPVFADADLDTLTYEITSSQPALATGSEAGGRLSVKGLAPGTAKITVTAKDGRGGETSTSFDVEVNAAPEIQAIPDQLIQLNGTPLELNLLPYIHDLEQDTMTLQAAANNTAIAQVQVNGFKLTITPVSAGLAQIGIIVTDSRGGESKANIRLTVNTAPMNKQQPSPQVLTVGEEDGLTDLSLLFADPDGDTLTYSAVSSNPSFVTVSENGGIVKTHALESGTATITVKAMDGRGGQASAAFTVTVNEPPTVTAIPLQKLKLPGNSRTLDLSGYLSDKEQDELTVTGITYNATIVSLSLQDLLLTMTPLSLGDTTVTMSVYDGRGGTTRTSFPLKVTLPNQDPVVQQPIPDSVLTVGQADGTLNLDAVFSDPDTEDTLTYEASSSAPGVASAALAGSQLTVHAVASGTADILLQASDGKGGQTTATWKITVNQPPAISSIADQVIWLHEGAKELDLTALLTDPDTQDVPNLSVSAISSAPGAASVTVAGKKLTIKPETAGSAQINLTVSDGRGGKATATIKVTVKKNQPPAIAAIPEQVMKAGDGTLSVDLTPYLSDPDPEDANSLTVSISAVPDAAVAAVSVTGKTLLLTPAAPGKTTVQLSVSDGRGGTAAANVAITVNPAKVNHAPVVESSIYEQVLTPGVTNARTFDLSQLFSDPDGDALTFTAVSASAVGATASVSGSMLTLTPGTGSASTKVTITATDGDGAQGTYELTVRTAQAVPNGQLSIVTKQGVKDPVTYDLSALFPGQSSFKVYKGTPDSTFTGPTALNGTILTLTNTDVGLHTWVVGSDGRAVVLQFKSSPQGTAERFFSQYLDGGDGRIAFQISYTGNGDQTEAMKGYSVEIHQWMKKTNTKKVTTKALFEGVVEPYIVIDSVFYDAFDIMNIWYFNDDLSMYSPNEFNTVALVLKRNGNIVDVLGDPNGKDPILPSGGTIIRKSGIYTGSSAFAKVGEWNTFPKGTYEYFGKHTK